jgi:TRAP-type C4-dicarboxylate transport system permease large subunit
MHLTAAHWVYIAGVVSLIVFMVARKSVVVPAIIATFVTAWVYTGDVVQGIGSVFSASAVATTELLNIFLVLTAVTAMLGAMTTIGAEQRMINPIARLTKNGVVSYFVLFGVTYLLSMVFWPTPSLALIAAILLPAAIRAGLSPLAAAIIRCRSAHHGGGGRGPDPSPA